MAVEPSALGNPQFDLVCGAIPTPLHPTPPHLTTSWQIHASWTSVPLLKGHKDTTPGTAL
jgi:hypothetical protein